MNRLPSVNLVWLEDDGLSWKFIEVWKSKVNTASFLFCHLLPSSLFLRIVSSIATDSLEILLVIFSEKVFGHFIPYKTVRIIDPERWRDLYKFT
jgi:hypothetical protein